MTQAGFATQLGVGTRTVQRWEAGELAPDACAEEALVGLCREKGLFRAYADGTLADVTASEAWLRDLLAAARLGAGAASLVKNTTEVPFPPPGSLPLALTSLVGREQAIEEVGRLLESARLVTLTGPGGTGKTRLALAVAEERRAAFRDGVAFVDLSPLGEPGLVASSIAQALGVLEQPGEPLTATLATFLRDKRLLLVLDNFEHVVDAAPLLPGLLSASPGLTALVTSRVLLRVSGEREYAVPPLTLPDAAAVEDPTALAEVPAVALFVVRAQDWRSGFRLTNDNARTVAEICARLDGLPLALELAAARTRILSPAALLARLDHRLTVLVGGNRDAPTRQRALRDAIAWSYDLLSAAEQRFFRLLAVFPGGWTLEAADAVCNAGGELGIDTLDALTSLADHSLVQRAEGDQGEPRFGLLATVREFAWEMLEEQREAEGVRDRHAASVLAMVEEAGRALRGPDVKRALDRLDAELDNIRAALRWAVDRGDVETAAYTLRHLDWFWYIRGHWQEGRDWCERILALPGMERAPGHRSRLLSRAGFLAYQQGDRDLGRSQLEQSVAIARTAEDRSHLGWALYFLAWFFDMSSEPISATACIEEAETIGRSIGDDWLVGYALNVAGRAAQMRGELERAGALLEESLARARRDGDVWHATMVQANLAILAHQRGDRVTALRSFEEQTRSMREIGDARHVTAMSGYLAFLLAEDGQLERAASLAAESLRLGQRIGAVPLLHAPLQILAMVALRRGRPERAVRLYAAGEGIRAAHSSSWASLKQLRRATEDSMRAALGDEAFAAGWTEGRALSAEDAIALALEQAPSA